MDANRCLEPEPELEKEFELDEEFTDLPLEPAESLPEQLELLLPEFPDLPRFHLLDPRFNPFDPLPELVDPRRYS